MNIIIVCFAALLISIVVSSKLILLSIEAPGILKTVAAGLVGILLAVEAGFFFVKVIDSVIAQYVVIMLNATTG